MELNLNSIYLSVTILPHLEVVKEKLRSEIPLIKDMVETGSAFYFLHLEDQDKYSRIYSNKDLVSMLNDHVKAMFGPKTRINPYYRTKDTHFVYCLEWD